MSASDRMKKALLMSSTMPAGSGGSDSNWLMGSGAHSHDDAHVHSPNCSHSHDIGPEHVHGHDDDYDDKDHEDCCDNTDPKGGCC